MKLSIITDTYAPEINGVARTLHQLATQLTSRGHSVEVIHPGIQDDSPNEFVDERRVWGFALPMYRKLRMGGPRRQRFIDEWEEDRPDVIYVATEGMLGYSAVRAARTLEIPVVTGYHTRFPEYLRHYAPTLEKVAETYLRHLHNQSECTLAPTRSIALELHDEGYHNVAVMGRGVNTRLFSPDKRDALLRQRWSARPETPVMLCVGRVASEKNLEVAFEAFLNSRRRIPDLKLVCVGDGPALPELKSRFPQVIWPGEQKGEELARYYASADLFLFPSTTETYGNVLPEAMASGLVSVAFHYAACAELVVNGQNGFSTPLEFGGNGFSASVSRALSNRTHWPSIASAARETTESLSWNRVANQFENILFRASTNQNRIQAVSTPAAHEAPTHQI